MTEVATVIAALAGTRNSVKQLQSEVRALKQQHSDSKDTSSDGSTAGSRSGAVPAAGVGRYISVLLKHTAVL
eukprot:COSAG06_NODE_42149_length_384_cov_0.908772_1_plen_71_part_01